MVELEENYRNIVVIGASAGGLEAILAIVEELPEDLGAAVFVVQHIPSYARSNIDRVIQSHTKLRVTQPIDGSRIEPNTIYIARADRHLMVEPGRVVVSKGPRENRFRPAVDALFRSAAHAYRDRVIGVVVSGALNDGSSGTWTIKRFGGTSIVQDPDEAMFSDMPRETMQYTEVDHVLPASQIGQLLGTLCRKEITPSTGNGHSEEEAAKVELEIAVAKGANGMKMGILDIGNPSSLACPECHGVLAKFQEGRLLRFRCHTGHAHTVESLLASVNDNVEKSMWEVMRGMEESKVLLDTLAEQMEHAQDYEMAAVYRQRAAASQEQAVRVQLAIEESDLSAAGSEALPHIQ
ncbi:Protein-glutamate methylesterase/protein-glutamine glutaminase [Neolewinella maritima]|uniref:protein-glutamate methylesterase n=1 Tax=Neolewinella maritima TaxID=1383882 RepID=A0ABM9AZ27_9BACT|nr:chemotaxis protein CheB [Neolewinella maritima]CAH0999772.1 Protein-glutamate methylesterase/protein-glutamine glutaminase [Neolewinella maritima]